MNVIKKFLKDNNIDHEIKTNLVNSERIEIVLEKDNVWVNGYGKEMMWDRKIIIHQNTYKRYVISEDTGYSMNKRHKETGKQKEIIEVIKDIMGR